MADESHDDVNAVTSSPFRINVFDCIPEITFPNLRTYTNECAMYGKCGTATSANFFCIDGSASTTNENDCPLTSATYSATSNYATNSVDTATGKVCWDTNSAVSGKTI